MAPRTLQIVVIEDSDEDFYSLRRALERAGVAQPPLRFRNALEFLPFLDDSASAGDNLAWIIILDLNLPGENGFDLLARIRKAKRLELVPVVILSTSSSPRDVEESYRRGASSYMTKSLDLKEFELTVRRFVDFYARAATLPAAR